MEDIGSICQCQQMGEEGGIKKIYQWCRTACVKDNIEALTMAADPSCWLCKGASDTGQQAMA